MFRRVSLAWVGAALLGLFALPSEATATPVQPINIAQGLLVDLDQASFWGLPYPYGYAYRPGRGVRHVYRGKRHVVAPCRRVLVCQ